MRIVASLFLVMLAAMAMTCDEHGRSPDGGASTCQQKECPFISCCEKFGRCFQCESFDAGTTSDAPRDTSPD